MTSCYQFTHIITYTDELFENTVDGDDDEEDVIKTKLFTEEKLTIAGDEGLDNFRKFVVRIVLSEE